MHSRDLLRSYEIGWLESCWLEVRAYAVAETYQPGSTSLAALHGHLEGNRRAAFADLVAIEHHTRSVPSAATDGLPEFIHQHGAEQPFFAAIAAIELAFQWSRFGGQRPTAAEVFAEIREHARDVGDVPVAAQLLSPPPGLLLPTRDDAWHEMIRELDDLGADPRLRGELRLQRLTDKPGLDPYDRASLALAAHDLFASAGEPHRQARALQLAEAAFLATRNFAAAQECHTQRAALTPGVGLDR